MTLRGFSCILNQDKIYGSASECDGLFSEPQHRHYKNWLVFKNTTYGIWSPVYNNKITVLNRVLGIYMSKILQIVTNWRNINLFQKDYTFDLCL